MAHQICTSCNQKIRVPANVHFSKGIQEAFFKFARVYEAKGRPVHLRQDVNFTHEQQCNWSKVKNFGLVAKDFDNPGFWFVTKKGFAFLQGTEYIPETVRVLDNRVIQEIGSMHVSETPWSGGYWQKSFDV